jgi:DNA-binding PucR family transcriptional regulator
MLTLYADIALLVPWLRDDTRAQWLVEMHLSPLDNHRCSGATLRKTLREYFAAGHNASAAARALYISRRTMRNRMVLIEGSLGPLLHTHQAELELALRLDELREDKQSYISQSGVTQTTLDA